MLVDKITQLERSHRRALLIALTVIATIGLYRWILGPYHGQLLAAQKYESVLDSTLHRAGVMDTTLAAKKAKIEKLTVESERLRYELFTPNDVRGFFVSLQNTVLQAGCVIQSVSAVPESKGGAQNQLEDVSGIVGKKAVVTVIGGYNNIVEFLDKLQKSERKVWIESVKMDAGGNGKLKCQVVLTLYCIERMETAL
jgi:hypothetical protein